ncbi:hypothetical protein TBLA_0B00180 [Henningerozyma blattae CBS 6284]|uniref:Uncharacterized protein n=1 Tax=Henningerozyma blattae (strain ATCC 34711 / CBS 6284 / DSM 70876 / NBRC 10599 / NRRL Y-10934 / UCD 77-7) TaxID=1071380 RepID=I2GXL1_HENB6|nr:hypothetical protein TBLA_0B00180 [Tetrapisispora blattae CBS 6284]CCH58863.1 hypothetical protein TBLA_0B00180 [Tetrapisispora blattae CBS 6284]
MDKEFNIPKLTYPGQLICPQFDVREENNNQVIYNFVAGPGTKLLEYNYQGSLVPALISTLIGYTKVEEVTIDKPDSEGKEISNSSTASRATTPLNQSTISTLESDDRIIKNIRVSVFHKLRSKADFNENVDYDFTNNLPKEGSIVLGKVTRITLQRANLEILAVENNPVPIDSGIGSNGSGVIASGGGSGSAMYSVAQISSDYSEPFRGILRSQDVRATERDSVKMVDCYKPGDIVRAQVLSLGDGTNYYVTTARNDLGVVFAKAANGAGGLMYAIDWQHMVSLSTGNIEKRKCAKPF